MGTNFYWIDGQNPEEQRHIGKSSVGWVFSLHVYPEEGINDLPDWLCFWDTMEGWIEDEYHHQMNVLDMVSWITNRGSEENAARKWKEKPWGYDSWAAFHAENHCEPAPRGLVRPRLDRRHVKHGSGTWVCTIGEFS